MSRGTGLVPIVMFVMSAACWRASAGWVTEAVRKRAAADFGCDVAALTAHYVEGREYTHTVQGCGKRANYIPQHCRRADRFCYVALHGDIAVAGDGAERRSP
jgi:hypothetical protein